MAFLTINGLTIEVRPDVRRSYTENGERRRAFDRSLRGSRYHRKRRLECQSLHLTPAEADALAGLVDGLGHSWRFDHATQGLYSSGKGLPTSATNGTITTNGASGKFDKQVTFNALAYARWTPVRADVLTGNYTLSVWRLTATGPDVWTHYLVRNVGGTVTYYENGVLIGGSGDVTWEAKLSVTAGVLQLADGTNADVFSDLVALPFAVPLTWPAVLGVSTQAYPSIPTLEVNGDVISSPTAPVEFLGLVEGEAIVPTAAGAASRVLSFALDEV